jgi:hypothetical protein
MWAYNASPMLLSSFFIFKDKQRLINSFFKNNNNIDNALYIGLDFGHQKGGWKVRLEFLDLENYLQYIFI